MDIVQIGYIALESTEKTLELKASKLSERFSVSYLNKAKHVCRDFSYEMSNISKIIDNICDDNAELIELSDTGILGGLWKLYKTKESGLKAFVDSIAVKQETIEILEYFDANPYTYPSKGTFLLACNNANAVINELSLQGIKASVIGFTDKSNERVIINGETKRFLTPDDRLLKDEQDLTNNIKSLRKELL